MSLRYHEIAEANHRAYLQYTRRYFGWGVFVIKVA